MTAVVRPTETAVPHPTRRIAAAAGILLAGMALSRVIGLLREMVIGARFGTSTDLDLYVAAIRIPDTVFILVAGGALGSTLVPVFAEYQAGGRIQAMTRLAAGVFNLVTLAGSAAAGLGIVFAPHLAPLLGAGFSEPWQQERLVLLIRIMLAQPVLLGMSEVVRRYLNVHQHFLYPALAPTLYNLGIIAAALALGPAFGTAGLAVGVVLGALAYLLVQLPAARRFGFCWQPVLAWREPGLRQIGRLMLPRLVGQGAVQLSFIVTTRLASYLPEGRLASLNFAWVLMMLPLGTFAMPVADAALPTLSAQAARGRLDEMAATVRRTLGAILFLMVPACALLVVAGLPLVQVLFERGAFTRESSLATAGALAFYAAGLPAHGAIEILTRSFYALHDTRTPVAAGVAAMGANVLLAIALVGPLGHVGLALAVSLSATAEAVVLAALLRPRLPALFSPAFLVSAGRTVVAGAALAAAVSPVLALAREAALPFVAQLVVAILAGGTAYFGAAVVLRSPELAAVVMLIRSRLRR